MRPEGGGGWGGGGEEGGVDGFVACGLADNELEGDAGDADVDGVGAAEDVGGDDVGEHDVDVVAADDADGGDSFFGGDADGAGGDCDGFVVGEHNGRGQRDDGDVDADGGAAFHFSGHGGGASIYTVPAACGGYCLDAVPVRLLPAGDALLMMCCTPPITSLIHERNG